MPSESLATSDMLISHRRDILVAFVPPKTSIPPASNDGTPAPPCSTNRKNQRRHRYSSGFIAISYNRLFEILKNHARNPQLDKMSWALYARSLRCRFRVSYGNRSSRLHQSERLLPNLSVASPVQMQVMCISHLAIGFSRRRKRRNLRPLCFVCH